MYRIQYTSQAAKAITKAPAPVGKRLIAAIRELAADPYAMRGVKKLRGITGYRLRVGDWRVIYAIHDNILTIWILEAGPRKELYR